jgi:hypothetical protein
MTLYTPDYAAEEGRIVLFWFRHLNREWAGDCLIVTARPREA